MCGHSPHWTAWGDCPPPLVSARWTPRWRAPAWGLWSPCTPVPGVPGPGPQSRAEGAGGSPCSPSGGRLRLGRHQRGFEVRFSFPVSWLRDRPVSRADPPRVPCRRRRRPGADPPRTRGHRALVSGHPHGPPSPSGCGAGGWAGLQPQGRGSGGRADENGGPAASPQDCSLRRGAAPRLPPPRNVVVAALNSHFTTNALTFVFLFLFLFISPHLRTCFD